MIVISGQMNFDTTIKSTPLPLRQLGFQEYNIIDSVKPMTKYAEMITDPKYIAYHLEKAFHLANNGRKGPVWLDIPLNIQSSLINPDELIHYHGSYQDKQPTKNDIDNTLNKLNNAKNPLY